MTYAEVEWVLDRLGDVVDVIRFGDYALRDNGPVVLKRVDRDDSGTYDGSADLDMSEPLHSRKESLEKGIYVGATLADRDFTPAGTEYNHQAEAVVGLTVEGLTVRGGNYGHVDPDGEIGAPFDVVVRRIRRALLAADARSYPDPGVPHVAYHDLIQTSDDPQSDQFRDFYRWQGDVAFRGYESLPD